MERPRILAAPGSWMGSPATYWTVRVPVMFGWTSQKNV